jgi:hypothetical protein
MTPAHRPKLAVWKFASRDGCQLELLAIAGQIKIAYFVIRRFLPTCAARPVSLSPFRMRYQAKVADGGNQSWSPIGGHLLSKPGPSFRRALNK